MNKVRFNEKNKCSDFDDFLREEGILEDCEVVAAKSILTFQIKQETKSTNKMLEKLMRVYLKGDKK